MLLYVHRDTLLTIWDGGGGGGGGGAGGRTAIGMEGRGGGGGAERPPRLSQSSWTPMNMYLNAVLFYSYFSDCVVPTALVRVATGNGVKLDKGSMV